MIHVFVQVKVSQQRSNSVAAGASPTSAGLSASDATKARHHSSTDVDAIEAAEEGTGGAAAMADSGGAESTENLQITDIDGKVIARELINEFGDRGHMWILPDNIH